MKEVASSTVIQLFVVLSLIGTISCGDNDSLFNERKNQIVGEWFAVQTEKFYHQDSVYLESSSNSEYEFRLDGTGMKKPESSFFDTLNFIWFYQYKPESYILLFNSQGILPPQSLTYTVINNQSDLQLWRNVLILHDTLNAQTDSITYSLSMTKK